MLMTPDTLVHVGYLMFMIAPGKMLPFIWDMWREASNTFGAIVFELVPLSILCEQQGSQ